MHITSLITASINRDNIKYPFTELLKVFSKGWANPYYFANDLVDVDYDSNTYVGYPFALSLLTSDDSFPQARLAIQNIDTRIGKAVINSANLIQLNIMVLARTSVPQLVYSAYDLIIGDVSCTSSMLSGNISSVMSDQEPFPKYRIHKRNFPGLYVS